MRRLLVLGAGTAGTIVVNRLRRKLRRDEWQITVVDQDDEHIYQPGLLFLPFGRYRPADVVRSRHAFIRDGVELVFGEIDRIDPDTCRVLLADGRTLPYDYLVVATGTSPRPEQTPGLLDGQWRRSIHEFYTYEGAVSLATKLASWDGGRLVVHLVDLPVKCPVASLEFAFLAESFFRRRDMRDRVEITFATPLSGAFTKPVASKVLGNMLEERKIALEPDFLVERVDHDAKVLRSYDERELPFDLLVTVPLNLGADYVARSGIGDESNFVRVDHNTLVSPTYDNIFALGDAAALPTSKAGSSAHFAAELFTENFVEYVEGRPMPNAYDGHTNCFIESGDHKAVLVDFNYDTEPLPGRYPLPKVGPFRLLEQSRINHFGKLGFRWLYWNVLLPGRRLPVSARMPMAGKILPPSPSTEV